jgi:hypothetical protein
MNNQEDREIIIKIRCLLNSIRSKNDINKVVEDMQPLVWQIKNPKLRLKAFLLLVSLIAESKRPSYLNLTISNK